MLRTTRFYSIHQKKQPKTLKSIIQKATTLITTFVLAFSSLAASVPLFLSRAYAATENITHIAFTTSEQTIGVNEVSDTITIQAQNAGGTEESLDTKSNFITITSSSTTGEFAGNADSVTWDTTGVFTVDKNWANKSFYYRDSTAGTHLLTVTLTNGEDNTQSWTETQSITVETVPTVVTGEHFAMQDDGFNVGFNVKDYDNIQSIKVELFKDDRLLSTNEALAATLDHFNNDVDADASVTSPFYIPSNTETDGWWSFTKRIWTNDDEPTKAVITVVDNKGTHTDVLSPYTINESATPGIAFVDIIPLVHNLDTFEGFSTIQAALDDSDTVSGHTIEVSPGTYNERVMFKDDGINLVAPSGAIIEPNASIFTTGRKRIVDTNQSQNVVIDGFTINGPGSGSGVVGITVWGAGSTVKNVTINDVLTGVQTSGGVAEDTTLENITTNNTVVGISLQSNKATVVGATINNASLEGFGLLDNLTNVHITGSNFTNINGPAFKVYPGGGAGSIALRQNNITNAIAGVDNTGTASIDATENWWGNESGPSGEGSGAGSSVGTNVNYSPWLCAPAPSNELTTTGGCDSVAPVMSGYQLSDLYIGSNDQDPTLTGSISDSKSNIKEVKYAVWPLNAEGKRLTAVRGWTYVPANDGAYDELTEETEEVLTGLKTLPEGRYELGVRGWDTEGNKANGGDFIFFVDNTKPKVRDIEPTTGDYVSGTVRVTATITDENVSAYCVLIRSKAGAPSLAGSCANPSNAGWTDVPSGTTEYNVNFDWNSLGQPETSTYQFAVWGRDAAGNVSELKSTNITVDNTNPNIVPQTPTVGEVIGGDYLVTAEITDANELDRVRTRFRNTSGPAGPGWYAMTYNTSTGLWEALVPTTDVPDGEYSIRFNARDVAGNNGNTQVNNVFVDNTKPSANVVTPTHGSLLNTNGFTVEGTASDNQSEINRVEYTVTEVSAISGNYVANVTDGIATYDNATNEWTFDVTGLNDGYYRLKIQAFDQAGNWKYDYNDVQIDSTAPMITMNAVAPFVGGVVTFSGTAADTGSGLRGNNLNTTADENIRLSFRPVVSGTVGSVVKTYVVPVDGTGNWVIDVDTTEAWFVDGQEYRVVARANDKVGTTYADSNTEAVMANTIFDNTAPVLTINPLANSPATRPLITGTTSDPSLPVIVNVDDTDYVATVNPDGTWSAQVTNPLIVGSHTVTATSTDAAGNTTNPVPSQNFTVTEIEDGETLGANTDNQNNNSNQNHNDGGIGSGENQGFTNFAVATNRIAQGGEANDQNSGEETSSENNDGTEQSESDEPQTLADTDSNEAASEEGSGGTFLGLVWYWWILILLALAALYFFITNRADET